MMVTERWLERDLTGPEKVILEKFPLTFRAVRYPAAYQSPIGSWGLEVAPGWYPLVEQVAAAIEAELQAMLATVPPEQLLVAADALGLGYPPTDLDAEPQSRPLLPFVSQVKEKLGGLRLAVRAGSLSAPERWERILAACRIAEELSAHTCEQCGKPGTLLKNGWWRVRCGNCEKASA